MIIEEAIKVRDELRKLWNEELQESSTHISSLPLGKICMAMDTLVAYAEGRVAKVEVGWKTAKAIVEESDRMLEIRSKQELLFLGEEAFYITVLENVNNKLNNQ